MKKSHLIMSVFSLAVFIGTIGCKKEHPSMTQGVIVGWNYGACVTCGGFYVNMSNDTVRNSGSYYVLDYPETLSSVVNQYATQYNKDHSPIYISFDWQPASVKTPSDPANWITITAIQSR